MFPIKKKTAIGLLVNLGIVGMTVIDLQAGLLLVFLIFVFEHGSDMIRRDKRALVDTTKN